MEPEADGKPGIRLRGVALFMNRDNERLGLSFCRTERGSSVNISPGLAALINGSTSKTSMKRAKFNALPVAEIAEHQYRVVRFQNKTIALFEWHEATPFAQVCSLLTEIAETDQTASTRPRIISVNAMVIVYDRGEVADRYGCIKASKDHELVVYEDRGEDLSFIRPSQKCAVLETAETVQQTSSRLVPTTPCGSERLQQKISAERAASEGKEN